jgi:hypothetical protein
LSELTVRYARWDLSLVHLYDEQRRQSVCRIFPVDKHRNADGARAVRAELQLVPPTETPPSGRMAPLLTRLLRDYRARGLAPAYLPHHRRQTKTTTIRRRRRK